MYFNEYENWWSHESQETKIKNKTKTFKPYFNSEVLFWLSWVRDNEDYRKYIELSETHFMQVW